MSRQENLKAQLTATEAKVVYWNAVIISGAYKLRKVSKIAGKPLNKNELLEDALGILNSHVERIQQLTDALGESVSLNRERSAVVESHGCGKMGCENVAFKGSNYCAIHRLG